jgi:hypothetical protein
MVLYILYFLLIFCTFAVFYRSLPETPVRKRFSFERNKDCENDGDCAYGQKCFRSSCVDVLNSTECDRDTGIWTLVRTNDGDVRLKCVCKRPERFAQSRDGTNCDVEVACGPHGQLSDFGCECDSGFEPTPDFSSCVAESSRGKRCHPFSEKFRLGVFYSCDCPSGYVDSKSPEARNVFHAEYLAKFELNKCLKYPCSFNVMDENLRPLKHTRLVFWGNDYHCACDPSYGNFGVRMDVGPYLKSSSGYNACGSVYVEEPDAQSDDVSMYCYYYMEDLPPVCFTIFRDLVNPNELFRRFVVIEESFSDTFLNDVLQQGLFEAIDSYECYFSSSFPFTFVCERKTVSEINDCSHVSENDADVYVSEKFMNVVYQNFLCRYSGNDPGYKDRIVVNPGCVLKMNENTKRYLSHGIRAFPLHNGKWRISFAPADFTLPLDTRSDRVSSYVDSGVKDEPVAAEYPVSLLPRG